MIPFQDRYRGVSGFLDESKDYEQYFRIARQLFAMQKRDKRSSDTQIKTCFIRRPRQRWRSADRPGPVSRSYRLMQSWTTAAINHSLRRRRRFH